MPTYPGDPDVTLTPDASHDADGYATSELRTGTHAGTHVDAPRHTIDGGATLDDLDVGAFAFDAQLVDCRPLKPREPIGAEILPDELGTESDSPPNLLVLRTGWAEHWGTPRYRDHPHLTVAAAERCRELGVGVALDTFGPDPTPSASEAASVASEHAESQGTPAHDVLLGDELAVVENLRGLDGLPQRFRLFGFPLRLRGGDGAPVRAVAEWEA